MIEKITEYICDGCDRRSSNPKEFIYIPNLYYYGKDIHFCNEECAISFIQRLLQRLYFTDN